MEAQQAFSIDLEYYEGRAAGFASVADVTADEARRDLAARHGFLNWDELVEHVAALRDGREPPSPFVLAYRALEARNEEALRELLDEHPGARPAARHERQRPARSRRRCAWRSSGCCSSAGRT